MFQSAFVSRIKCLVKISCIDEVREIIDAHLLVEYAYTIWWKWIFLHRIQIKPGLSSDLVLFIS